MVIDQRAREKNVEKHSDKYQKRYPFSVKIICGPCGSKFKRRIHSSGRRYTAWCCSTHIANTGQCAMKYIPESELEYAFVILMNKLIFGHTVVLKPLLEILRRMNSDDSLTSIRGLDKKLEEHAEQQKVLVGLMTKGYLEPAVYNKSNNELLHYTSKTAMLTDFDGDLFTRFMERIIVYSRTEMGFELKCGITRKESLVK